MPNRVLNILGVIGIGIVSSLIAWVYTRNWQLGMLLSIIIIVVSGALLSLPFITIRLVLYFNKTGILKVYLFQSEAEKKINMALLAQAKEIDVLTIRGLGIFGLKDSLLRQ